MNSETIDNVATITLLENNILKIKFLKGSSIDVKESETIIELSSKIANNKLHANLVDTSEMMFMSRMARANFAKQDKSDVVAIAVVINSKMQSILGNMYLSINKPVITTKLFDNYTDAENWLETKFSEKELN